jgi:hypothetical protein
MSGAVLLNVMFLRNSAMTGPRPAGRPWTKAEEKELLKLLAASAKVGSIARKLNRSPGAIYARINTFKRISNGGQRPLSLPSERLAWAIETHDNAGQQET